MDQSDAGSAGIFLSGFPFATCQRSCWDTAKLPRLLGHYGTNNHLPSSELNGSRQRSGVSLGVSKVRGEDQIGNQIGGTLTSASRRDVSSLTRTHCRVSREDLVINAPCHSRI
eukprot:9469067-Pyramimonas_sp.AAC.1